MTDTPGTTVVQRSAAIALGVPLPDLGTAISFAKTIAHSELIPNALRGKPGNVLVVILYGQEIGLSAMQAMQNVHVVEGRPSMSAELWRAKLRDAGHRYYIPCRTCGGPPERHAEVAGGQDGEHPYVPDQSDRHCLLRIIRGDNGARGDYTYTIEEAVAAGRCKVVDGKVVARSSKGSPLPWETHTQDMLFARVTTRGCRAIAPEIALGWTSPDEAEEIVQEARQVPAERTDQPEVAAEPEDVAAEVADIEAEFTEDASPDEPYRPEACQLCGAVGHFEEDCPTAVAGVS